MSIEAGALVNVTIAGVRMGERSHIRVTVETQDGELWVLPPNSEVERIPPADWPPRPGDLWKSEAGDLWFTVADNYSRKNVMLPHQPTRGLTGFLPDDVLAKVASLKLVHREQDDAFGPDRECGGQ